LAAVGAFTLWRDVAAPWDTIVVVAVLMILVVRVLPLVRVWHLGKVIKCAFAAIGALVIPVFALLGIDAAFAAVGAGLFAPLVGLGVGGLLIFAFARVALEPLWTGLSLKP
jgi:hypothetical protein